MLTLFVNPKSHDSDSRRGPEAMKKFVGLAAKRCIPCEGKDVQALDIVAADKLRSQTPGWRIVQGDSGQLSLRQDWKVSFLECLTCLSWITSDLFWLSLSSCEESGAFLMFSVPRIAGHVLLLQVSSFVAGLVLFERVAAIAEVEGHHPNLHLEGYNNAWAELSTHSVGMT